jgi:succinate dehydrogenase/fumarate reductase-like Fe-S protein
MHTVTLKVQRFDPEKERRPYWAIYQVEVEPTDRLLDALNKVKWEQDGTLTFRRSCGHGVCGSDAIRCRTVFNCTECCPRGIPVTGLIAEVKRARLYGEPEVT